MALRGGCLAFDGQVIDGIKITVSGMLAGAHLVGAGNLNEFLLSGGDSAGGDGNNVSVRSYVRGRADFQIQVNAAKLMNDDLLL
ncbi:MAG: hypothetical protein ACREDO_10135 [Methyloceanibacter sp.]